MPSGPPLNGLLPDFWASNEKQLGGKSPGYFNVKANSPRHELSLQSVGYKKSMETSLPQSRGVVTELGSPQ